MQHPAFRPREKALGADHPAECPGSQLFQKGFQFAFAPFDRADKRTGAEGVLRVQKQAIFTFDCERPVLADPVDPVEQDRSVQIAPILAPDGGLGVDFPDARHDLFQICGIHVLSVAEQDGIGVLDLVGIEGAEHLHVVFESLCLHQRDQAAQLHLIAQFRTHLGAGAQHIAEATDAGRLDHHAVGLPLLVERLDGLLEISHQGTADAACSDLRHGQVPLDQGAVDGGFAVFVLDDRDLALAIRQDLIDEGRLTRPQESGNNIDSHLSPFSMRCLFASARKRASARCRYTIPGRINKGPQQDCKPLFR